LEPEIFLDNYEHHGYIRHVPEARDMPFSFRRAPTAMPSLIIKLQRRILGHHPLPVNGATLGRLPNNTVVIDDPSVSRKHAAILWDAPERRFLIRDLGSRNGVIFLGEKVAQAHLSHGDEILLGKAAVIFLDPENAESVPEEKSLPVADEPLLLKPGTSTVYPLEKERVVIGKSHAADLFVEGFMVAPDQVAILREGDRFTLVSTNRVRCVKVNGRFVEKETLRSCDFIQVGRSAFIFLEGKDP